MNCKTCSALHWHPNKGFYCTVPRCNPTTTIKDVREIYERAYGVQNTDSQTKDWRSLNNSNL